MSDPNQPEVPGDATQPPPPPAYPTQPPPGYQAPPPGYPPPPPSTWATPAYQPAQQSGGLTNDELTWGSAAHWSSIVAMIVFLAFLGPLIVLLTKGNDSPYIRRQAVESLNFQLSWLIYGLISLVLVIVLIGLLMLLVLGILWLVFIIIASVRAANGEEFRYPMTIRMVR